MGRVYIARMDIDLTVPLSVLASTYRKTTLDKYEQVKRDVDYGVPATIACKRYGMSINTWQKIKRKLRDLASASQSQEAS